MWDGVEHRRNQVSYCQEHLKMTSIIEELKKSIEKLLERQEANALKIESMFKTVWEQIEKQNEQVIRHDEAIKTFKGTKTLIMANIAVVLITTFGMIAYWNRTFGNSEKQIEVNTHRIDSMEAIHPRISADERKVN
jgi:hypothetical protein